MKIQNSDTKNKLVVVRGKVYWGVQAKVGEGDQEIQTLSQKINVMGIKCTAW